MWDDPCINDLPGVALACCGHGDAHRAILEDTDDNVYRDQAALDEMRKRGGTPWET